MRSKSADDTYMGFRQFLNRHFQLGFLYTDESLELQAAAKMMMVPHAPATPGIKHTNGIAENTVRWVIEGTRSLLVQAGLPHCWWP